MSIWDVMATAALIVAGALYANGSVRLARRGAVHRRGERAAFAIGWAALVAAIVPPLDTLVRDFFSAHMAQHELMMLVGAPLVVAGRPLPVWLAGLPVPLRTGAASLLQSPAGAGAWRGLTSPLTAWVLHGLAIWVWHVPALYELAVRNEAVHALQHAMFVGTAALFWWGMVYGRYGRAGYGAAVFYVFTTTVHTGLLGAILTLAQSPLYPGYAATAAGHGMDPLEDQQLAGLIMWVPAGLVLTMLGIALFAAWLGEAERRARPLTRPGSAGSFPGSRSSERASG
jgi:putative membrane protein